MLRATIDALRGAVATARELIRPDPRARRSRLERFGAIVQITAPRALVFVDRERARARQRSRNGASGRPVVAMPRSRSRAPAPVHA